MRIAVIMAGGSGERFWPLSRRKRPKQLLKLSNQSQTLLEEAVSRAQGLFPREHIFIATAAHLQESILNAGMDVPEENVLGEPCQRNTSGCLAFVAAHLLSRWPGRDSEISMALFTADHLIGDGEKFQAAVLAALEAAESDEVIATIGLAPTRVDTGFGYIERADEDAGFYLGKSGMRAFPVIRFREKPDMATAREFVNSGRFFWNSGMFFWRLSTVMAELVRVRPSLAQAVTLMAEALNNGNKEELRRIFEGLENISLDYALMEHARRVVMIPAEFFWEDVGSWGALFKTFPKDSWGNVAVGDPVLVDAKGCLVYNEPGAEHMAVAVLGVENLVVVATTDGVLVVSRDRVQDVRSVIERLKERGAPQL
jgi:mannose-1-phosphate guanylyltransferase